MIQSYQRAKKGVGPQRTRHTRSLVSAAIILAACALLITGDSFGVLGQKRQKRRVQSNVPLTSHSRDSLTPEAREMIELASGVVCKERIRDPKGSVPIDDMQARPSLPVRSPEAIAGALPAQRLLPIAKSLVVASLKRLARTYGFADPSS